MTTNELSDYDQKILVVLDTVGGYTTSDVGDRVWPEFGVNRRTASAAVRSRLLDLEAKGFVKRLDDEKPVCWVKVEQHQQ
ncbi:TPA: hypothetical protein ACK3Q6_005539 [Burkholderia cepacia]|jgi:hypothetical protein|uniref:MarR family transcriptional regulator n=2 Tax=Burkholderia cepacia complex TaxID=87882 RepID=A0A250LLG6_9BURK|nr:MULTISPECIES: hypothetical protein [Burkholderia]HDV6370811.1 hypothetical protein [Burkholderia cepacia]MBA9834801.1 hypothetical protein [Burkholderia contaminans]MBA9842730.1 hypothetical protein [Burkholderia contaminans]MBA9867495.1 hypothetical protein [Burkholderia contaminans]MBA9910131.1 hypothetical protein [Burkholderia contaminans]